MVHKKSEYRLQFHSLTQDLRKQIWQDNIRFRELRRSVNQAHHYWSYQINDEPCVCDDAFDDNERLQNPTSPVFLDSLEKQSENQGYVQESSFSKKNKGGSQRQVRLLEPETEDFFANEVAVQTPDWVHEQKSAPLEISSDPQHSMLNLQNSSPEVDGSKEHASTQPLNVAVTNSRSPSPHLSAIGNNSKDSKLKFIERPSSACSPDECGRNIPSRFSSLSKTSRKYFFEDKKMPFVSYGWNDTVKKVGDKKTYNVSAPEMEVHSQALRAQKKRRDEIERYLQREAEINKCSPPSKTSEISRCVHESQALGSWCNGFQWGPKSNYTVQNKTGNSQMYPQHAKLKLRIGETKRIKIKYKRFEDYPIDLYFLLDVSETMRNHTIQVSRLAYDLAYAMKNITSNFQLGFGSFVDKVAMPFVFTAREILERPCLNYNCATPYSFKNDLPLNNDPLKFSDTLEKTRVSTNNDSPEGGLDALMQAMVCTDKIKWRLDAHHLLVFSTDDLYHIAGDGKLAGAVEPNPGICMMNEKNEYIGYADYDYPTISQINEKAIEKNIIIIFAVTKKVAQDYSTLSNLIKGSRMQILSQDSKNVINIIVDEYNKFGKSVKLIDDVGTRSIGIVYYSNCSDSDNVLITNECNNIPADLPVYFEAAITVKTCPPNVETDTWKTTVNIRPYGSDDKFQLDLEVFCSCPCEFPGHKFYEVNSSFCHYHGNRKCGICECDEEFNGETCECEQSEDKFTEGSKLSNCISDEATKIICSNRGNCICGKCVCNPRQNPYEIYYGKYCQCDNFHCKRHNGMLCSGPGKGRCSCGKCECEPGWTGEDCKCPQMQTGCVAPGESKVCSGQGKCVCGKCECFEKWSGKYCSECVQTATMACPGGRCKEFADCVECMVHQSGRLAESLCLNCSLPHIKMEDAISEGSLNSEEKFCKVPDDAGCSFVFTYLEEKQLLVRAVKTKECSTPINVLGVVLGVSGTTLFLGILGILIWKLLTSIHDRREYARYVEELENTKWAATDNPLHQVPTTTTFNPTYHSRRSRFSFMR